MLCQGPVTVFLMAVPVVFSLLALLRVECASGLEVSNRVAHALAMINHQMIQLGARQPLTVPLDVLMVIPLSLWQQTILTTLISVCLWQVCTSEHRRHDRLQYMPQQARIGHATPAGIHTAFVKHVFSEPPPAPPIAVRALSTGKIG